MGVMYLMPDTKAISLRRERKRRGKPGGLGMPPATSGRLRWRLLPNHSSVLIDAFTRDDHVIYVPAGIDDAVV